MSDFTGFLSHSWGENGVNHEYVVKIRSKLRDKNLNCYLNEDRTRGPDLYRSLEVGRRMSKCFVAFPTVDYLEKISAQENNLCKFEFKKALRTKSNSFCQY